MNPTVMIACLVLLSVAMVSARPEPGFADQLTDMGLDTGSIPDFSDVMCKNGVGTGKLGFPGMDKIPGMDKFGGGDCDSKGDKTTAAAAETTTAAVTVTESS